MERTARGEVTLDMFAPERRRGAERLTAVMVQISEKEGRNAERIGRISAHPNWAMRREMLSGQMTTEWNEHPRVAAGVCPILGTQYGVRALKSPIRY